MHKKIALLAVLILLVVFGAARLRDTSSASAAIQQQPQIAARKAPPLTVDGLTFKDLNKNGRLDQYEDWRLSAAARAADLTTQMNVEEKAGLMFINGTVVNDDGTIDKEPGGQGPAAMMPSPVEYITAKRMNNFNYWAVPGVRALATGYNAMQELAEASRLGIPVTIASDPRNSFTDNYAFSAAADSFSLWPEPLGLAAIGDEKLTQQFAEIARQEYLATGIRLALHPMADLATEPRWPRINGTFGEDARLSARLTKAYVLGFQGAQLGPNSVACMTKHFAGGGPQKEGLDPHFEIQKGQVYPGNNFNYHLIPFEAAFAAHTAQIMPYYGVPVGQTKEDVGFAYNKAIITQLLRNKYKFDGVVCTDWGLISDTHMGPTLWKARAWGVEKLSTEERIIKLLDAGVDQFGGEMIPETLVKIVQAGKVAESRLDVSVKRILRDKFLLGLFENPYVEVEKSVQIVGKPEFKKAGEDAQRRAMVLLKNEKKTLPLTTGKLKIFVKGIRPEVAAQYGQVVEKPEQADFAIIRLKTPWVPVESDNPLAKSFHHGDLDFKGKEKDEILALLKKVPTITVIYLDRPAVIPEIAAASRGLLAEFGASDRAVLDVIFGKAKPQGKLPIELPSSMEAVRNQKEDLPYDSKNPLFKFGFGLTY